MAQLPVVGGSDGDWGAMLNEFLLESHNEDGTQKNSISTINVKDFGAKGDGIADAYDAIQAAVATINEQGGGILFFPPGTYKIDRYIISGGDERNDQTVKHVEFKNCNGLKVLGYGAKIDVKGDFHRSRDFQAGVRRFWFSYSNCVIPFDFIDCTNFSLEGFEIDGNVDQMTRDQDPEVGELPAHGIATSGCSNYTISNVFVHHFQTDGILLGWTHREFGVQRTSTPDQNALLMNVKSSNNGRQGLSIIQVAGGLCLNCQFLHTGITDGDYGWHLPGAGVDIEPNLDDVANISLKTGNISFIGCEFSGNRGTQFAVTSKAHTVHVDQCRMIAEQDSYRLAVIVGGPNVKITSSLIDAGEGMIAVYPEGTSTKIIDCEIRSSDFGISSEGDSDLLIERCRLIGTFTEPTVSFQPYLVNSKCRFIDNYVFRPGISHQPEPNRAFARGCRLRVQLSKGNSFDTDLIPPGNEHFPIDYGVDTIVDNDWFIAEDSTAFRHVYNGIRDNSLPFSKGLKNMGDAIIGDKKHASGTTAPTDGSWVQGDIVYNTQPSSGGNIGWVCVVSGEPGIWKEFGSID